MGCGASRVSATHHYVINEGRPGQGRQAAQDFKAIGLQDEIVDQLYSMFCSMDRDDSGQVDLDEFYKKFGLERSPFSDRVFAVMDDNKNGEIDFREFVLMVWNYCSLDTRALSDFAFQLFDLDNSGFLSMGEVRELVAEVYGDLFDTNHRVQKILKQIDSNQDGQLTLVEFKQVNRRFPVFLFPAFRMQQELRRKILGEDFWVGQLKERMRKHVSMVTSIWQVLDAIEINERNKLQTYGIQEVDTWTK